MKTLPVLTFPNEILATRASEVDSITEADRRLVRQMIETMYAEQGVGLAANQVGSLRRVFVASADQVRGKELVCFNPVIVRREGEIKEFEGCLSVPELYEPVKRARRVWMRALQLDGRTVEIEAQGLLSRIFQHEIDHLDGVLFINRLGLLKSRSVQKKLLRRAQTRRS